MQLSTETTRPENAAASSAPSLGSWQWPVQATLLAALLLLLYYRILGSLVLPWIQDPNYSHAFFVPIFCAWVIWKERARLKNAEVRPSWFGVIVILGALGMLLLGVLGAENFLSRTSLLFLIAGMIIYFRGWSLFRAALFPWACLFLMIPLPAIIFNQLALPLQFQASKLASAMLSLVGVPVLREGNVIHLPSLTLDVVEACSGLRSLVSLITLAVICGYLFESPVSRRVLLLLAAVPVAVVANGFRIMGSGILGEYWSPEKAEGFFHLFSGLVIFLVSFGLLLAIHGALSLLDHRLRSRST